MNFVKQILPPLQNIGIANYNALDTTPYVQTQNEFSARIDQTLGNKDFFWFRYSGLYYNTTATGGLPGFTSASNYPADNYGASWVHTFSPSLVLQAQFGRSKQENNGQTVDPSISSSTIGSLGFASSFGGNFIATPLLLPSVGISGYTNPIPGTSDTLDQNSPMLGVQGERLKIIGSHTLRFGGELSAIRSNPSTQVRTLALPTSRPGTRRTPPSLVIPWLPSCWVCPIVPDAATFMKRRAGAE